jgi:hypothetical protein
MSSSTLPTSRGTTATTYRVEGPTETLEDILEGRRRVEARQRMEAVRIQREQLERRYRQDLCELHERIALLRHECEDQVARVRLEWEQAATLDRDEAVGGGGEEEEEEEEGSMDCDGVDDETEVDPDSASSVRWSLTDSGGGGDERQHDIHYPPSSSHSARVLPPFGDARPEVVMTAAPAPPSLRRLRGSPLYISAASSLRQQRQGVQPLRRQPAQLMAIPLASCHPNTPAYKDSNVDVGRTEDDKDSEMGDV